MTNDVVVIGGGVSGLAGALALARARRSVLVVDAGEPRNAPAAHTHGYLTRDGIPPRELLKIGRLEVRGYGAQVVDGTVTAVKRLPDGRFRVALADGTEHEARRVLVATGLDDVLPDVPGLSERWGRDVVHCPYCFGWDLRDQPLGVLATGPRAVEVALMWRQWSPDIVLFQHTQPPVDDKRLEARGITVVAGEVVSIEVTNDRLSGVRLRSGEVIARRAIVVEPQFEPRRSLVDGDDTSGIWFAGNADDVKAGLMQSAALGVTAAVAINADLTEEDTALALQR
ncbi:NAD(P)/FAD-dependent oxidoreductase [Allorhizocola rhizosphaerae]|uniref:NAD(P)/FAD-dependent oxidoreductase n=1 Tax=Allorhizocola rhizosphaerae TaxID=1872709 RepID=UPI000E3BD4AC|nr:NAD(P)/FAD-dependent oxidoreductase [Allorhizocola rhizosphaerae]